MKRAMAWVFGLVLAAAVIGIAPRARADVLLQRFAVVVGANRAIAGRRPLRFAHADARGFAEVLARTGGFAPDHVSLLLDPEPSAVLATLDQALARAAKAGPDSMLLFYYSGHADQENLYPNGHPLALPGLHARLADRRAKIRVGLIDACRGGGWTGSKGLSEAEPFEVDVPTALASEGSVLIASSSGVENAHESEALEGSFFTHHWNAALRGAADANADGRITVNEAFAYARELTVRDTALVADVPQHPSFRMDLLGRDDPVLATIDRPRATLTIEQLQGPLQLVHLGTGVIVVESRAGTRQLHLALEPGRYLVRRREPHRTFGRAVEVATGSLTLRESDLEPVGPGLLSEKSLDDATLDATVVPDGRWESQLAAGVRHAPVMDPGVRLGGGGTGVVAMLRLLRGIGRFQAALPLAAAYTAGDDKVAWVPWAGVPVLGFSVAEGPGLTLQGLVGAGLDARWGVGYGRSVNAGISGTGTWQWSENQVGACTVVADPCTPSLPSRRPPNTWSAQATFGYSHSLGDLVTFNLGVGAGLDLLHGGHVPAGGWESGERALVVSVGSVQRRGLLALPLVRVRLRGNLSVDGHVQVAYVPSEHGIEDTYLAGVTSLW